MRKINISRAEYKAIKKYNREEMDKFLENLYRNGFKDGAESGIKADFKILLVEVLKNTKGIGATIYNRALKTYKEMEG